MLACFPILVTAFAFLLILLQFAEVAHLHQSGLMVNLLSLVVNKTGIFKYSYCGFVFSLAVHNFVVPQSIQRPYRICRVLQYESWTYSCRFRYSEISWSSDCGFKLWCHISWWMVIFHVLKRNMFCI